MPDIDDVKAIAAPYRVTMTAEAHMEAWARFYERTGAVVDIVEGRLWIDGVDRTRDWATKYAEFVEDDAGYYAEPN